MKPPAPFERVLAGSKIGICTPDEFTSLLKSPCLKSVVGTVLRSKAGPLRVKYKPSLPKKKVLLRP
jgi:hypothetical protein